MGKMNPAVSKFLQQAEWFPEILEETFIGLESIHLFTYVACKPSPSYLTSLVNQNAFDLICESLQDLLKCYKKVQAMFSCTPAFMTIMDIVMRGHLVLLLSLIQDAQILEGCATYCNP